MLHVMVLLLSVFLVVSISIDTFKNVAFYHEPRFMKVQLWICLLFMADFFIELLMSRRKRHYILTHFIFFLVSVPYESIIRYFSITLSPEVSYLMQFVPLVRGGYALAIVTGWFTSDRTTGMFVTYLLTLASFGYFVSMVFFVVEHNVNPAVIDYQDALWWTGMQMVTTGSSITPVTPIGRILGFCTSAMGMMMLPLFTVYITSIIKRHSTELRNNLPLQGLVPPPAKPADPPEQPSSKPQ